MKRGTRNGYPFCHAKVVNLITALVLSALRGVFFSFKDTSRSQVFSMDFIRRKLL